MSRKFSIVIVLTLLTTYLLFQTAFAMPQYAIVGKGDSGSVVTELQQNLKALGFFNTNPTGYFGSITQSAVINFQRSSGIDTDGIAGYFTQSEIDRQLDKKFVSNTSTQVVIDPGHGGGDTGATMNGVIEKEVTLDISRKLQDDLNQRKYASILTRNADVSLQGRGATLEEKDLSGRARIINRNNAKLFVSVHVNSLPEDHRASGAIVFYNPASAKSRTLALSIQAQLNSITINGEKRVNNNPQTANFYVLRFSNIPGVLVETAFITNTKENAALSQQWFRAQTAQAIETGIENSGLLN